MTKEKESILTLKMSNRRQISLLCLIFFLSFYQPVMKALVVYEWGINNPTGSLQTKRPEVELLDARMKAFGLVDVQVLDSTIIVELKYASQDNFMGQNLYGNLRKAYLNEGFARRIVEAQRLLRQKHPGYSLLIYDAARPISVQRSMYASVVNTPNKVYVADGDRGGRHNYGVAVDLTIANGDGTPLDMGSCFDCFGKASHTGSETELIRKGLISPQAAANRALLRGIMKGVGLVPYWREWWHYEEPIKMQEVRCRYPLLDF